MKLTFLTSTFAVSRLDASSEIPSWAFMGSFYSVSKTEDELSIVCAEENVPDGIKCEKNWKILKVVGPLDFNLTGILASIANPLASAKISIFALSTFDTDYLLVRAKNLKKACEVLIAAGFVVQ